MKANPFPLETKIRDFILRCVNVQETPQIDKFFELALELFPFKKNVLVYIFDAPKMFNIFNTSVSIFITK